MTRSATSLTIRLAVAEDAAACGRICYEAFSKINLAHGFACDFPNAKIATGLLQMLFSAPGIYCVVAEEDGGIVGSNCLDERSVIAGVGPITIDPDAQSRGIGRQLMQAVLDRSRERGVAGVRLLQAAFHGRSLSLYESLGFDVREPLACMQGRTLERSVPGCAVRVAGLNDLDACNALSYRVHGFDRGAELKQGMQAGSARVVERDRRITAYTSGLAYFGHTTAETNLDLQALIMAAESFGGPGILVPMRNNALFRWCLSNGLRVVHPMTLMSMGLYSEPAGAWLPSVIY